jgi:hypothetical protein
MVAASHPCPRLTVQRPSRAPPRVWTLFARARQYETPLGFRWSSTYTFVVGESPTLADIRDEFSLPAEESKHIVENAAHLRLRSAAILMHRDTPPLRGPWRVTTRRHLNRSALSRERRHRAHLR